MSGGAYDYGYFKVLTLAEHIESNEHRSGERYPADEFTPVRKRVSEVLRLAADMAKAVEWADSSDTSFESAREEINELLLKLVPLGRPVGT